MELVSRRRWRLICQTNYRLQSNLSNVKLMPQLSTCMAKIVGELGPLSNWVQPAGKDDWEEGHFRTAQLMASSCLGWEGRQRMGTCWPALDRSKEYWSRNCQEVSASAGHQHTSCQEKTCSAIAVKQPGQPSLSSSWPRQEPCQAEQMGSCSGKERVRNWVSSALGSSSLAGQGCHLQWRSGCGVGIWGDGGNGRVWTLVTLREPN